MGATKDLYIQIRQIEEALWPNDPRGFEKAIGQSVKTKPKAKPKKNNKKSG